MAIARHGHYPRYFESVRVALMRRIGYLITGAESGARFATGYTRRCAVDADGESKLCAPEALVQCLKPFL